MNRLKLAILVIPIAMALMYVGLSQAASLNAPEMNRASVGFGATISDAEFQALLQQYSLRPVSVDMWTSGITGTHRTYKTPDVETFLSEARTKSVGAFEHGLKHNSLRLKWFVDSYTEEQVMQREDLQTQARSLLNLRANLDAALVAGRNGGPLIYGAEVAGEGANLERLQMDPRVLALQLPAVVNGKVVVHSAPKPDAYQQERIDPKIESLSVPDVYRRIKELASSAGN